MMWLCDLMTSNFQMHFVVDGIPLPESDLAYYLVINEPTEQSEEITSIGIDIAGCVLKQKST